MKVLYYFKDYKESMYSWQHYHIVDELARHGCNIEIFDISSRKIEEANEKVIEKCKNEYYDLFMTDQDRSTLFPETVTTIHNHGTPSLLIHFDNKMDPKRYIGYAEYFDCTMLLNKDDAGSIFYSKYNSKCIVAPYAANPFYFKDLRKDVKQINRTCFVGTPYGTRCIPINTLTNVGVDVDLYANQKSINQSREIGSGMSTKEKLLVLTKTITFPVGRKILLGALKCKINPPERLNEKAQSLHVQAAVDHLTMNRIYSAYALSLSMPEARNTGVLKKPVDIVHLRNFEIPMCAGLQITRYFPELAECFEEDKEIIFYHNREELIDKVKYYTDEKNSNIVDKMKTAARERAKNEHTWYKRFKPVFDYLGVGKDLHE